MFCFYIFETINNMYCVQNEFILIYLIYYKRYRKKYSKEDGFLNVKTD